MGFKEVGMKITFKNGSTIETIGNTRVEQSVRGKRSKMIFYDDLRPSFIKRLILKIKSKMGFLG